MDASWQLGGLVGAVAGRTVRSFGCLAIAPRRTINKLLGTLASVIFIFTKEIDPVGEVTIVIDDIGSVFLHFASALPDYSLI